MDRLLELQTVPGPVRYAKGEHNCRAEAKSHPRGGIGGPGRDAEERGKEAFARLDGLVDEKGDHAIVRQRLIDWPRRAPAVDHLGAGTLADPQQVAVEVLVVERAPRRPHVPDL